MLSLVPTIVPTKRSLSKRQLSYDDAQIAGRCLLVLVNQEETQVISSFTSYNDFATYGSTERNEGSDYYDDHSALRGPFRDMGILDRIGDTLITITREQSQPSYNDRGEAIVSRTAQ